MTKSAEAGILNSENTRSDRSGFRDHVFRSSLIRECARLARSAERWGAEPQGGALAELAQYLASNDIVGAMWVRDDLLEARNDARSKRLKGTIDGFARSIEITIRAVLNLFLGVGETIAKIWNAVVPIILEVAFLLFILGVAWISHRN